MRRGHWGAGNGIREYGRMGWMEKDQKDSDEYMHAERNRERERERESEKEGMIEEQKATARNCLVFSKLLILLYGNELRCKSILATGTAEIN